MDFINNDYNVTVEFEKYSKKFERVGFPEIQTNGNNTDLIVNDRNRIYHFNMRYIHFWTAELVKGGK